VGRLEEAGEEAAQEAVAGWEAKYCRLRGRYRVRRGGAGGWWKAWGWIGCAGHEHNTTQNNTTQPRNNHTHAQELRAAGREEVDALHEQLDRAHEALAALEAQVAALEGFRATAEEGRAALGEAERRGGRAAGELERLERENGALMQVGGGVGDGWLVGFGG
jgi:hypothetical protein